MTNLQIKQLIRVIKILERAQRIYKRTLNNQINYSIDNAIKNISYKLPPDLRVALDTVRELDND